MSVPNLSYGWNVIEVLTSIQNMIRYKKHKKLMKTFLSFFQISGMGVAPFFVENISELQLNAMKLVTTVSVVE